MAGLFGLEKNDLVMISYKSVIHIQWNNTSLFSQCQRVSKDVVTDTAIYRPLPRTALEREGSVAWWAIFRAGSVLINFEQNRMMIMFQWKRESFSEMLFIIYYNITYTPTPCLICVLNFFFYFLHYWDGTDSILKKTFRKMNHTPTANSNVKKERLQCGYIRYSRL